MTRSATAVHLALADRREWLFEQNPVDRRRVTATLVDHTAKSIVIYEEAELRMALRVRGWADVVSVGFDWSVLATLTRTREVRTANGVEFTRYTAGHAQSDGDVWWSSDYALADRFTANDGAGRSLVTIERIKPTTDVALLRPAILRFPEYRVVSYADSLEKH